MASSRKPRQGLMRKISSLFSLDSVNDGASSSSNVDCEWEYQNVILNRNDAGFGFYISGGIDNPHNDDDTGIYIMKLVPGGVADGVLKINDNILEVNGVSLVDVTHGIAVQAIHNAKEQIQLNIRRRRLQEIELYKGVRGLGFSITGGIEHEDDPGIYVSRIFDDGPAQLDGRLKVGDKLVAMRNSCGEINLESTTHDEAVAILKATQGRVVLVVVASDTSDVSSQLTDKEDRNVVLYKDKDGLGFNIIGGEDGEDIFISFIQEGGPADLTNKLHQGDKILSINGISLQNVPHDKAVQIIKESGSIVNLSVQYSPDEFIKFESKHQADTIMRTSKKRSMYVRTLFDYNPRNDEGLPAPGLAFIYGDILHVTNASDDEWWQAKKMESSKRGIVPSGKRWERKQRSRNRRIKFLGEICHSISGDRLASLDRKRKNFSFSRKFPFMKSREGLDEDPSFTNDTKTLCYSKDDSLTEEEPISTYKVVKQIEINYPRPVVILGPMKDRINTDLCAEYPEKFDSCVPYTTRPKREYEIDGKDYHFVESREEMERKIENQLFIEAGQYNDHLYGTCLTSVHEVAENGKHCILDVSGNAIKRLHNANLYPIVIFIKPKSTESIMEMNKRMTEELAKKTLDRSLKIQSEFQDYFTAIVQGDTPEEIYTKVKQAIHEQTGSTVWVPSNEEL